IPAGGQEKGHQATLSCCSTGPGLQHRQRLQHKSSKSICFLGFVETQFNQTMPCLMMVILSCMQICE
uniref:Uncharacterized protein n=1 Tax=Lates calcarifer TaxID=8187 RepID=A0A4W6BN35_LATCA